MKFPAIPFFFSAILVCSLTLGLAGVPAVGAETTAPSPPPAPEPIPQQRWAAFPVLASSPETGVMLGGMLFHFFPVADPAEQASTVDLIAYGTTEGQYAFSLSPNLFLDRGRYRLHAGLSTALWEADYYSPGNDSPDISEEYEATSVGATLTFERRFFDSFVGALLGLCEYSDMEIEPGGMLASGVPGAEDGTYVGLGFEGGYDTRDNTNAPQRGNVVRYRFVRHDEDYGSDLDFTLQKLEWRHYRRAPWIGQAVLALGATAVKSSGTVPFRHLPTPDGTLLLRGIEAGRYRERELIGLQTEVRFSLKGRFSGTAFIEAAQVAPEFEEMEIGEFKTSIGIGVRYALNPEQRFNLRGDIAWVDDGVGIILNIREAF